MYQINAREFIEDASEWIYDLSINHIPSESIDHAKIMLIDTIGASLASSTTSYGRQVVLDFLKMIMIYLKCFQC